MNSRWKPIKSEEETFFLFRERNVREANEIRPTQVDSNGSNKPKLRSASIAGQPINIRLFSPQSVRVPDGGRLFGRPMRSAAKGKQRPFFQRLRRSQTSQTNQTNQRFRISDSKLAMQSCRSCTVGFLSGRILVGSYWFLLVSLPVG